jgi:hypothetical protein
MSALHDLTARDAAARVRRRDLSSVELTRAILARARTTEPNVGAYLTLATRPRARGRRESTAASPPARTNRSRVCRSPQGRHLHRGPADDGGLEDPRAFVPAYDYRHHNPRRRRGHRPQAQL